MLLTARLQPVNAVDLTGRSVYVRAYKSRKRSVLLPPFGATQTDVAAAGSSGRDQCPGVTRMYTPGRPSRTGLCRMVSSAARENVPGKRGSESGRPSSK
jgi:hypothetical protein